MKTLTCFACVCAVLCLTDAGAHAATYGHNDLGLFGHYETWTFSSPHITINSLDDFYSARFTAMENVTVDRGAFRFQPGAATGVTIRMGVMADNGSGSPTGTYLTSGDFVIPSGANVVVGTFDSSLSLVSGNVYHLVAQALSFGTGTQVQIFSSSANNSIRPYDRALDPQMRGLTSLNGGAWTLEGGLGRDPYFFFANGSDTAVVAGPGQPISSAGVPANNFLASTASTFNGQQFQITDKEVPTGAAVWISQVSIAAQGYTNNSLGISGLVSSPLLVRLRDASGNILATATLNPADADGTTKLLTFDEIAKLEQGQTYLLTTEFSPGSSLEAYRLAADRADSAPAANWGGTSTGGFAFPIQSSNAWSTWIPRADRQAFDLIFQLSGQVFMPEPLSAVALAAAMLLALGGRGRVRAVH